MEIQITTTDQTPVKFQGRQQLLPESVIQSLPDIVKKEILYPKLNDKEFGMPERQKTVTRIINMFQMKFEGEGVQQAAMAEFGTFLRDYSLTSEEVLEAYRMTAKLQLLDLKGNPIEFFPNLSIGQAGKILKAYEDYKIEHPKHTEGYEKIKSFLDPPPPMPTEEEIKIQRENLIENIKDCIEKHGVCEYAFLIYEDFQLKEDFQPIRDTFPEVYERQFRKFMGKEKQNNFFFKSHEIKNLEEKHPTVMQKLKDRKCKKSDMVPHVYQLTKNELIEKYLKQ